MRSGKKGKKNARTVLLLPCVVKSPPQKKCEVFKCKKTRALFFPHISTLCSSKRPAKKSDGCAVHVLPFFFSLISVRCAVRKDPPKRVRYVERTCFPFFFFPSYQYVVQFPPKRVTYKGRSTALSFIIVFKCKNGGLPELSLVGQAVWCVDILSGSF